MKFPLVRLSIPYIAGMLVANLFADSFNGNFIFLIIALIVFLCAFIFFHNISDRNFSFHTFNFTVFLLVFTLGATLFLYRYNHQRALVPSQTDRIEGKIVSHPEKKTRSNAFRIETETGATLLVYTPDEPPNSAANCVIRHAWVQPTDKGDSTFADYRRSLFYSGICATAYSREIEYSPSSSFSLLLMRNQLSDIYHSNGIDGDEGAIIEAMTTGNKQALSRELRQQYSKAGVSHILALSGYHLTLIYALLEFFLMGRIVQIKWRWITNIIILLCLWAFAFITGMPPSLLRATIMCSILILSKIFYRNNLSLNSLALAAFIMLTINPLQLFDVGFQLSFTSMLGILVVGGVI